MPYPHRQEKADQLPKSAVAPLLYDLFPALTWDPDATPYSPPHPTPSIHPPPIVRDHLSNQTAAPSWHCSLSSDATLVAILTDSCIEVHPFGDLHIESPHQAPIKHRAATWTLPTTSDRRDLFVWRKLTWSSDGHWVVVADGGVVYLLAVCTRPLQLSCSAVVKPRPGIPIDPIVFISFSKQPTTDGFLLISVSLHGTARLAHVSFLDDSCPDALNVSYDHLHENNHCRFRPCTAFDLSPWFHAVTDATWVHSRNTLYVTGVADCPPNLHRGTNPKKDDQSLVDTVVPVIPLFVTSGGIHSHTDIQSHVPLRSSQSNGWLGSIYTTLLSLLPDAGRRFGIAQSNRTDTTFSSLELESAGIQISSWQCLTSDHCDSPEPSLTLLLLRDAGGNLLVLDGDLEPRDRYDCKSLAPTQQGTSLSYAAWWNCPMAYISNPSLLELPGIVTSSQNGVVMIHSYPDFTPLSSAEQFDPPLAISHTLDGWGCILDCELSGVPDRGVELPFNTYGVPAPPGLVARSLKYLTNTLLWHFDDDTVVNRRDIQSVIGSTTSRRHVTMYQWCPLTPQEMLMRYLVDKDYESALDLAVVYEINTDIVYQRQWAAMIHTVSSRGPKQTQSAYGEDDLIGILSRITDKLWVLQSCVDACPSDAGVAHELLAYGLGLTELAHEWADRILARVGGLVEQTESCHTTHEPAEEHVLNLVAFRLTLLRLKDRLELFTRIHGRTGPVDLNADPNYRFLRSANLVDVACAYARLCDTRALSILYSAHPSLAPFRLIVAGCFPSYVDPSLYADVALPNRTNCTLQAANERPLNWRDPDWCEHPVIAEIIGWIDDPKHAADALDVQPIEDIALLTDWYLNRARDIEASSGCVEHALHLLDLASALEIPGLESLATRLSQLNVLLYDLLSTVPDTLPIWQQLSLAEFESISPDMVFNYFFMVQFEEVEEAQLHHHLGGTVKKSATKQPGSKVMSFEQAARQFLVPYILESNSHVELLDELVCVFPNRPELVVRMLSFEELWRPIPTKMEHHQVEFAAHILEMGYSIDSIDTRWLHILGVLRRLIPDLSEGDDPNRAIMHRKVLGFKSLMAAAEILAHLDLLVSPKVLRDASKQMGVVATKKISPAKHAATLFQLRRADDRGSWTQDQFSILRELVRRTPMVPSDMEWLIKAMNDLVALKFWRIPVQDVFTPVAQHALLMNSDTYFQAASTHLSVDTLKKVVMQLVHERAEANKFKECIKILETANLPVLAPELVKYRGLATLQELGVPGLSYQLSTEELLSLAAQCQGISRDAVFKLGKGRGMSEISIMSILIANATKERAVELALNMVLAMASMSDADRGLVCDSVIGLISASACDMEVSALLHSCLEFAPPQYIPKLIGVWDHLGTAHTQPTSNDVKTSRNKLVCPLYSSMFRTDPTFANVLEWFTTDEYMPRADSAPKELLLNAVSIHSALAAARCCSPHDNDALFHPLLLFSITKRMAARSLPKEAGIFDSLAVTCTPTPLIDEYMHLSSTDLVDPVAVAVATEFRALGRQTIDRAIAEYPEIDSVRFCSSDKYREQVFRGLFEVSRSKDAKLSVDTAVLLAEHAEVPLADLLVAWLEANAACSKNLMTCLPRDWNQWINLTCENQEFKDRFITSARKLLESELTTNQCQAVLYHTIAKVVPESLHSSHERQGLAELIVERHLHGWSAQALSIKCLTYDRAYFLNHCQAVIHTENVYDTVLEIIPKLSSMAAISCIDSPEATNNGLEHRLTVQDLESIATAAWLSYLAITSASSNDPATKFFYSIQTSRNRKNDDGRLGRLFASITNTGILSPAIPSSPTSPTRDTGSSNPTIQLLHKIQPVDWLSVREVIVQFFRQCLGTQHLALMTEFLMTAQAISEDMAIVALLEAAAIVTEYAKHSFVNHLLTDPNAAARAINELLLNGYMISDIQSVACKVASVQSKLDSAMHKLTSNPYSPSVFERDLCTAFQSITSSHVGVELLIKSISRSERDAEILIRAISSMPESSLAQLNVESMIAQICSTSPALTRKRDLIRIVNGSMADISADLSSLYRRWMNQGSGLEEHEHRIQKLMEWTSTTDLKDLFPLWLEEFQFSQGLSVDYIVNLRLQLPSFPLQMERDIIQNMKSQVHILAFALTSTDNDLVIFGVGLLPPPAKDEHGKTLTQAWPSPILDALIPVLQLRQELGPVSERFGISALSMEPTSENESEDSSLLAVLSDMHPALWASMVVGRIPRPASVAGTSTKSKDTKRNPWESAIELSDVDNQQRTLWARSKYKK